MSRESELGMKNYLQGTLDLLILKSLPMSFSGCRKTGFCVGGAWNRAGGGSLVLFRQ